MRKAIFVAGLVLVFTLVIIGIVMAIEHEDLGDPCTEGATACDDWCNIADNNGIVKESPNLLTNPSFEIIKPSP